MSIWKRYLKERKEVVSSSSSCGTKVDAPSCSSAVEQEASFDLNRRRRDLSLQIESICADSCTVGPVHLVKYFENVLSVETEEYLLHAISTEGSVPGVWKQLKTRRLQCWGGIPPAEYAQERGDSNTDKIPLWLEEICTAFSRTALFEDAQFPNHVLINEYQPAEGIMHHTDGPLYLDRVAIISLGSSAVMTFRRRVRTDEIGSERNPLEDTCQLQDEFSVILRPRSVLYFSADAYSLYMHGIAAGPGRAPPAGHEKGCGDQGNVMSEWGGVRTSLTIRHLFGGAMQEMKNDTENPPVDPPNYPS